MPMSRPLTRSPLTRNGRYRSGTFGAHTTCPRGNSGSKRSKLRRKKKNGVAAAHACGEHDVG